LPVALELLGAQDRFYRLEGDSMLSLTTM